MTHDQLMDMVANLLNTPEPTPHQCEEIRTACQQLAGAPGDQADKLLHDSLDAAVGRTMFLHSEVTPQELNGIKPTNMWLDDIEGNDSSIGSMECDKAMWFMGSQS